MFSLFVKPSELQRWDRYSCSYSRFLNKYYHKAHSSYALLQRHRLHRGQASPPAPESCWPHKPMRWQQWSLPDVCGAAALLPWLVLCRGCSAPEPPATAWGWHSWPRALPVSSQPSVGTWRGSLGWFWVCFTVGNSHVVGKLRVLNDCGRMREKNQGSLNVDMSFHQCY